MRLYFVLVLVLGPPVLVLGLHVLVLVLVLAPLVLVLDDIVLATTRLATAVPILVFLGLSVLDLSMIAYCLMHPPYEGGGITSNSKQILYGTIWSTCADSAIKAQPPVYEF